MRSFLGLFLLASVFHAEAAPTNSPRQSGLVQITSVSPQGPGCPTGSFSISISPDGSVASVSFTKYNTHVSQTDLSAHRELFCDLSLTVRYPLGCTAAVLDATYRGFAQLQSGVTGTFSTQYNLSPGTTGANPPATSFTSQASGGVGSPYVKEDKVATTERINTDNQRNVSLIARTRIFVVSSGPTLSGTLTDANATIAITQQHKC